MNRLHVAAACAGLVVVTSTAVDGQTPKLDILLARVDAYLTDYEQRMSAIVADEHYVQRYDTMLGRPNHTSATRTIESDFAFWAVPKESAWMGFRDTYVVDGSAVRDRDNRLPRILAEAGPSALQQAHQISANNARYNIGDVPRTINVPTLALGMIHPKNRWRFRTRRAGEETLDGDMLSKIEFREFQRPTIIRTREDAAQPAKIVVWIDAESGEVHKTMIDLEASRMSPIDSRIIVQYRREAGLGFLVPREMAESYHRKGDRATFAYQVIATATYSNYRRFQTSGRLVP